MRWRPAAGRLARREPTRVPARPPSLEVFPALRAWQRRALVEYLRRRSEDFLAVATPGAGKTTFALRIAAELLADGTVEAVTVVAPTEHLKSQWSQARPRGSASSSTPRSATPTCTPPPTSTAPW